mgnify:CR=1 FL=1|tara:strand:- start:718 stop:1083 length:366 start_codon:yes stop_codon:yes gene_type:complete
MTDKLLQGLDLDYMRTEAVRAMPDTVDIQRQSKELDGQGGFIVSWSEAYQNIPARLTSRGGSESTDTGRLDTQLSFTLTLAYDQSIEADDRVLHSSGTYEVQSVDTGKSWTLSKRCQMRQI